MKTLRLLIVLSTLLLLLLPSQAWGITDLAPRGTTHISNDLGLTWDLLNPGDVRRYPHVGTNELIFNVAPNALPGETVKVELSVDGAVVFNTFSFTGEQWTMFAPAYGAGRHTVSAYFFHWGFTNSHGGEEYVIDLYEEIPPVVTLKTPFVSTRISKRPTFKVEWSATDASGIDSYMVRYRAASSKQWSTWIQKTGSTAEYFKGSAGRTYYFQVRAEDKSGNYGWSGVRKTVVPYNEGTKLITRSGFNGYKKSAKSSNYLTSVRYSNTGGDTMVYQLMNTDSLGLVTTKDRNRGRAMVFVDGTYASIVNAYSSKTRPRQLIFYRTFKTKGLHELKIVNLGTPRRPRFDIDAIVAGR